MLYLASLTTGCLILVSVAVSAPVAQQRSELSSPNVDDIATLLKLEDTRQFDALALGRILKSAHPEVRRRAAVSIGRLADARGLFRRLCQRIPRSRRNTLSHDLVPVPTFARLTRGASYGWQAILRPPITRRLHTSGELTTPAGEGCRPRVTDPGPITSIRVDSLQLNL